jgi:hypothetical protein
MEYEIEHIIEAIAEGTLDEQTGRGLITEAVDVWLKIKQLTAVKATPAAVAAQTELPVDAPAQQDATPDVTPTDQPVDAAPAQ